jgi:hypothetical protein
MNEETTTAEGVSAICWRKRHGKGAQLGVVDGHADVPGASGDGANVMDLFEGRIVPTGVVTAPAFVFDEFAVS